MSSDDPRDRGADFDWDSPRWRDPDSVQGDVERSRRFRGQSAPRQRGAIDNDQSVEGASRSTTSGDSPGTEPDPADSQSD